MKKSNLCIQAIARGSTRAVFRNLFYVLIGACYLIVGCKQPATKSGDVPQPPGTSYKGTSVALPGGRPNYVVSYMGGGTNTTKFSCIRTYTFTAGSGTTGTVVVKSWAWYQNTFTGNASNNKVYTGYTTAGCTIGTGSVRTPLGFEPGATPPTLNGTYYIDINGRLVVNWPSGNYEIWTISNPKSYYAKLTIFSSSLYIEHGWGFGSNAPLTGVGATLTQIKAAGDLTNQDNWYNSYNTSNAQALSHFPVGGYQSCGSNPTTLQVPESQPNVCDRYHSYVAGNPVTDGRKNYWNHQLGEVGCYEAGTPCPTNSCTQYTLGAGGGHTYAMLQVLDDNGVFRGWVGAEASLDHRGTVPGGAIVGASYWMQP